MVKIFNRITDKLTKKALERIDILLLAPSSVEQVTKDLLQLIEQFVEEGNAVIVMGREYNGLLSKFGMEISDDIVIRVSFKRYANPKEAFLINIEAGFQTEANSLVYANGSTVNLATQAAYPLLTSGSFAYPADQPLVAVSISPKSKGRVVAFGSSDIFSDKYIELEDNIIFCEDIFQSLKTSNTFKLTGKRLNV